MAGRSGRTVINININTGEDDSGVFDLLGRGLVAVNRTSPEIERKIDVKLGGGLDFDADDNVEVNAGAGLFIDSDSKINVMVGDGLAVGEDNRINVTAKYSDVIGDGLAIDGNGKVVVNTGEGLDLQAGMVVATKQELGDGLAYDNQGRLIVDNTVPGPNEMFQAVSDIKLSFEEGVLTLTKIMTTYNVARSKVGNVVSVNPLSNKLEYEHVTLGGGGYGLGFHTVPARPESSNSPSFYKV